MLRITRFIVAALVALLFSTPAFAQQQQSADATASVSVVANLTLTNTRGMDFGAVFASAGIVRTSNANSAEWTGTVDAGNTISVTFSLPSGLARQGGGGNGAVPFSCNTISGGLIYGAGQGGSPDLEFNPYVGTGPWNIGTDGSSFLLALGRENSVPNYGCTVDVSGRTAGTYTGVITATVTVL